MKMIYEVPKKLLTIDNVNLITGISKSTLRFWEKVFGEYLKPDRSPGGQRRYTVADLKKIFIINRLLKVDGYTLTGAKKRLGLSDE